MPVNVRLTLKPMHELPMKLLLAGAHLPNESTRYDRLPSKMREAFMPHQARFRAALVRGVPCREVAESKRVMS